MDKVQHYFETDFTIRFYSPDFDTAYDILRQFADQIAGHECVIAVDRHSLLEGDDCV